MPKYSNAKKQEALELLESKTIEEVAAMLNIHPHTLQRWRSGADSNSSDTPKKAAPKKGRAKADAPKGDVLALARQLLEDGDMTRKQRIQELETENAKLREEAAALRQKCDEYHAVVEALVAMIH